ncbi:MAG TPA: hypothetical protein VGD39_12405 [Nocardioides sp.]|jgi:hypothetical protein
MTGEDVPAEPDPMEIFDSTTGSGLVCRVCGCVVAEEGAYPRAHYDWHEASNGA